jgi:hypothetical protein
MKQKKIYGWVGGFKVWQTGVVGTRSWRTLAVTCVDLTEQIHTRIRHNRSISIDKTGGVLMEHVLGGHRL